MGGRGEDDVRSTRGIVARGWCHHFERGVGNLMEQSRSPGVIHIDITIYHKLCSMQ